MAGIAAIMVVSALGKLTELEADSFAGEIGFVATHLDQVHGSSVSLAADVLE